MSTRRLPRAGALSIALLLAVAGTASADTVAADGDALTPVVEGTVHLGDVGPGAEIATGVRFVLTCGGLGHVDPGQSVVLTSSGGTQPADGAIVSVGSMTLGPVPTAWTPDGEGCPTPAPSLDGGELAAVVLRAPTAPADGYMYTVTWDRSLDPVGSGDTSAFGRTPTTVSFTLDVVANVPPTLLVPGDHVVEGDTAGGWLADWPSVDATDPEDDPDPVPTCDPTPGSVVPLGATTVTCTVTDSAGAATEASFAVTVVDTTPPLLVGTPGDQALTTSDPAGAILDYALPTASDVVDPVPSVGCSPGSGTAVGPGTTTVTCTATDATGNTATTSFDVTVTFEPASGATATWLEPIGEGSAFVSNRGRSLPVKVRLTVDGVERTAGTAWLGIVPCGGGEELRLALTSTGGRWQATIQTASLPTDCATVTAVYDGAAAGSFRLELRGTEAARGRTARR